MTNTYGTDGITVVVECAAMIFGASMILYLILRLGVWRDNIKNRKQIDSREANKNLHKYDGVKDYLDNKRDRIN